MILTINFCTEFSRQNILNPQMEYETREYFKYLENLACKMYANFAEVFLCSIRTKLFLRKFNLT